MPVLEAAVGCAVGAAGTALAAEYRDYIRARRNKWSPENRPCGHPFDCDFREALGLVAGVEYSTKQIQQQGRQAVRWWHPDRNDGVDRGCSQFLLMLEKFMIQRVRKEYARKVVEEKQLNTDLDKQMDWRVFNTRFLRDLQTQGRIWASSPDQRADQTTEQAELCHVFLDGSASMIGKCSSAGLEHLSSAVRALTLAAGEDSTSPTAIEKGKLVLQSLWPRCVETPTSIHLIGSKTGESGEHASQCLVQHGDSLDGLNAEAELLDKWSAMVESQRARTYLWQYIHEKTKVYRDLKHEVVIITDGTDNESSDRFKGLHGFNELLMQFSGGKIRISLYLIGNSLTSKEAKSYKDMCLATGGFFFHDSEESDASSALPNFVVPLLLDEDVRDDLAQHQQATYQRMLENGEAERFSWFLPVADGGPSGASSSGQSIRFNPAPRSTTLLPELVAGTRVKIHGLQKCSHHNGKVGTCHALTDTGRWEVILDNDPARISVHAKNLQLLTGDGGNSRHVCTEL